MVEWNKEIDTIVGVMIIIYDKERTDVPLWLYKFDGFDLGGLTKNWNCWLLYKKEILCCVVKIFLLCFYTTLCCSPPSEDCSKRFIMMDIVLLNILSGFFDLKVCSRLFLNPVFVQDEQIFMFKNSSTVLDCSMNFGISSIVPVAEKK